MRITGRSMWAAVACLILAGLFDMWSRWYAEVMVARGQGFEMAHYFSLLAFRIMDVLLLIAGVFGVIGAFTGPRWYHRVVAVGAGTVGILWFTQLPWR